MKSVEFATFGKKPQEMAEVSSPPPYRETWSEIEIPAAASPPVSPIDFIKPSINMQPFLGELIYMNQNNRNLDIEAVKRKPSSRQVVRSANKSRLRLCCTVAFKIAMVAFISLIVSLAVVLLPSYTDARGITLHINDLEAGHCTPCEEFQSLLTNGRTGSIALSDIEEKFGQPLDASGESGMQCCVKTPQQMIDLINMVSLTFFGLSRIFTIVFLFAMQRIDQVHLPSGSDELASAPPPMLAFHAVYSPSDVHLEHDNTSKSSSISQIG
jgi:hypothetical protein